MDRIDGPQTPFEVYCYHCKTTFAAGTRTCVHCGDRIGRNRPIPAGEGPLPEMLRHEDEEEEGLELSIGKRLGGLGIWVLIAVGATLIRLCEG